MLVFLLSSDSVTCMTTAASSMMPRVWAHRNLSQTEEKYSSGNDVI